MVASTKSGKALLVVFALVVRLALGLCSEPAQAHADLLQCPYPATGFQAIVQPVIGTATGYICNYPLERGMQHLHAEYGGYFTGGSNNSIQIAPGTSLGPHLGIGMSLWSQSWRCPDERYIAAPPNGIGWWKDQLNWKGVKCPAVERAPLALNAPWPPDDPNIVVVVNQILPPGEPDPTAAPIDPAAEQPAPAPHGVSEADKPGTPGILAPVAPAPVPLTPQGNG